MAIPWGRILLMGGPVLALLLGGVAVSNVEAIQYGTAEATAGNYGITGVAGLGSLVALVSGLVAAWRTSGTISPTRAAELTAVSALAGTRAINGDSEGGRLVATLAAHLAKWWQQQDDPASVAAIELPTIATLNEMTQQRIRQDLAESIEATK